MDAVQPHVAQSDVQLCAYDRIRTVINAAIRDLVLRLMRLFSVVFGFWLSFESRNVLMFNIVAVSFNCCAWLSCVPYQIVFSFLSQVFLLCTWLLGCGEVFNERAMRSGFARGFSVATLN
jgi:hypothetical protein